ncbi:MAG: DegT/DnrJ/EryC1/StrS family aminotransferase, partial [Bacteroidales bacterium]
MRKIQMVDLHSQYQKVKNEIDEGMQEVIDSSSFINGPQVKEFAAKLAEYLNINYVIPCANGTDALQIALMALDLQPGDEVITPDFTFISTVEVVKLLGLTPVLVDVDEETFLIDTDKLERVITEKTKAIVPVHLFGQCANMYEINRIAKKYNLAVIEDAAQAIGTDYNYNGLKGKAGTLGDIGCTSFFPSKNLGCFGDGGACITHDPELAERLDKIVHHGAREKYYNEMIGINSRLDTLQAAVLIEKLKHLDDFIDRRRKTAEIYLKELKPVSFVQLPENPEYGRH